MILYFGRSAYSVFWAHGVVVSRLLCMQKASGSNPDKSKFFVRLFTSNVLSPLKRVAV